MANDRIRITDLYCSKQLLYQLSQSYFQLFLSHIFSLSLSISVSLSTFLSADFLSIILYLSRSHIQRRFTLQILQSVICSTLYV